MDPGRGASGRTCGGLGRGSPRVLGGSEVNGGRTPKRPSLVGGVGCNRATGQRPSEGGEGCARSNRSTREGGPKRDHDFRQCRPYRTVFQGGSAIPEGRATGATTSTITLDCDRPIDERKGLPPVQVLSETAKQVRRKEGKVTMKPLQPDCQSNRKIRRESEGRGVVVASPSWAKEPSEEGRGGGC